MKRFLFYIGHPAHYHMFKICIAKLIEDGYPVKILIKKKDILEQLLTDSNLPYTNIMQGERGDKKWQIALSLLKRDWEMFKIAWHFKPDLLIGTSAEITHVGKFIGKPSIVVNEDDAEVVPLFAKLAYPLATKILAPDCCNTGKWESKKIAYPSYHELAYLHPNNFSPNKKIIQQYQLGEKYFLIRFAKLNAHHDEGRSGINASIARKILEILKPHGKVWITSERELEPEFEPYRISIPPLDIHHAMAFAQIYIGDSQTMAAEAAVLGVPAIRFNDFVGEIGYLNELEDKYKLGYGIRTKDEDKLYQILNELVNSELTENWNAKRNKMLSDKIDFAEYQYNLFKNFN